MYSYSDDDEFDDDEYEYESSSDINGTDEDIVVKTNRTIRVQFSGYVDIEVVEPPQVFEAEIKQAVKRTILTAIAAHKLGAATGYNLEVTN